MPKNYRYLDNKLFNAFMAAAEAENFTTAARSVFMTQSGISQHVARLEEQVGVQLFRRTGNGTVLTDAGMRLKEFIEEYARNADRFLESVRQEKSAIRGTVVCGLVASVAASPPFRQVIEQGQRHPGVVFNVTLGTDEEILGMLLARSIDFAVLGSIADNIRLQQQLLWQEELILVGSPSLDWTGSDRSALPLRVVLYPGAEANLQEWIKRNGADRLSTSASSLPPVGATINSLEGALMLVRQKVGVAIFPRWLVEKHLARGELMEFPSEPVIKDVFLASLDGLETRRVVREVMGWFVTAGIRRKPTGHRLSVIGAGGHRHADSDEPIRLEMDRIITSRNGHE